MKFGILTYHRTNNYGALMQAVAIRVFLEKQGHEVYYVDYWPHYHESYYKPFDIVTFKQDPIKKKIKDILLFIRDWRGRKQRINAFQPFLEEFIYPYCRPYETHDYYDVLLYGSDQIWRKQKGLGKKYNFVYFGQNKVRASRQISYAASMGDVSPSKSEKERIKQLLSRFDDLGVRENNINNLLHELGLSKSHLTIDPTLLLDSKDWDVILKPHRIVNEPYALLFQVSTAFDMDEVKRVCAQKGLRLITISHLYKHRERRNEFSNVSPYDFINLIKYADLCFVSSFHGLVFSINYERPFYASVNAASDRVETILNTLNLKNYMFSPMSKLPTEIPPIDYVEVKRLLSDARISSTGYLLNLNN